MNELRDRYHILRGALHSFIINKRPDYEIKQLVSMQIATINHPMEVVEPFCSNRKTFLELAVQNNVSLEVIAHMLRCGASWNRNNYLYASINYCVLFVAADAVEKHMTRQGRYPPSFNREEIQRVAFNAIKYRALEVCMALQDFHLDANRLMKIVFYDCLPFTHNVPKHLLWKLVTTVKHFHKSAL